MMRMMDNPRSTFIANPVFKIEDRFRFSLEDSFYKRYIGSQPNWTMLGFVTYLRTYSRSLYDANGNFIRSEEFADTLKRVTEGTFSVLKQQVARSGQDWDDEEGQEKAQEFFQRMWDFKWLPPGRGLWMMGTKYVEERGGAALNNCGFVSTKHISKDLAEPFITLMDYSMLGVGMGFDVKGTDTTVISNARKGLDVHVVADSREGWIALIERAFNAFEGKATLPSAVDYSRVRPEGAPIRTFGGSASGPAPLDELYNFVCDTLSSKIGQRLQSVEIVDLMNCIGRCVVAGNVRRSSEIALGDASDKDFLAIKDPTESIRLQAEMQKIAESISQWKELETHRKDLLGLQKSWSVLDPECLKVQKHIDQIEKDQKEVLRANLEWRRIDKQWENLPLVHHRWASNNSVSCDEQTNFVPLGKQTASNGEPGFYWLDIIRAYGRLSDPPNYKDSKAEGFNPCGEQTLYNRELCCLVETFPTKNDSLEDYKQTLKFAYLYAKTVTCVPTHNAKTNAIISRNRRIGTSMADVASMYMSKGMSESVRWFRSGYDHIRELDSDYSGWMGVPESIKVTSIKPGGTIPLVAGVEGGMKWSIAPFYFRTIRIDRQSPLVDLLYNAGYRVEEDRYTPRSMVVYFPCKSNSDRFANQISIWEQVALAVALQEHWSDNQVSATIMFQPHEADDIARVLDVYKGKIKAISFLPYNGGGYVQAPYIPCSQSEYEQAMAKVDESKFRTQHLAQEKTHEVATEEKFCSSESCTV